MIISQKDMDTFGLQNIFELVLGGLDENEHEIGDDFKIRLYVLLPNPAFIMVVFNVIEISNKYCLNQSTSFRDFY